MTGLTATKMSSAADKGFAHYGASFLVDTVQCFRMEQSSTVQPRDELSRYLQVGPEPAANIVQWWGVSGTIR